MIDVAQEAGVSVATVSRVVNGSGQVSKRRKRLVEEAMKRLNYHPSSLARSFKKQQTGLIGVLIPILEHPSYSRMASAIEQKVFDLGYRAIICNSEEDEDREKAYVEMLLRQRVEGIIINSAAQTAESLSELADNGIPLVLFDRYLPDISCNKVFCDNSLGGYTGMKYLIELGHRRIGVVAAPTYPEPIVRRLQGIREALAEFGLDDAPELTVTGDTQLFDMGYNAALQLMRLDEPPTAIFALTDVTAVGVMHGVAEAGFSVPGDVSVLGYDDLPIASYMMPPMTTIAQPHVEMANVAVDLLMRQLGDMSLQPETAVLETKLIVRASTAANRT
jgi:LacI family transcriptional regulator